MKRVIGLVDCNNFFVSCERLLKPELIGKPVCVLSNNDGCVVSRSNEAKRMGIEMGAPYFMIKTHYKKAVFLSGNLPFYCEISARVMDKLKDFTPDIEVYSIDEAFLDLTGLRKTFNCSYDELIEKIVTDIKNEIGIDVSIGLSYSKVLAKLACDKSKKLQINCPETTPKQRIYKIGYREIPVILKQTLISDVWGVGKNTTALLKKYLIQTAYDFTSQNDFWIKSKMGKIGLDLKQELLGNPISPVKSVFEAPKIVSRSESFKEFQTDINCITEQLCRHIHKVAKKLRSLELNSSCISVMLRTKDFQVYDIKINLISPTNSEFTFIEQSKIMLNKMFQKDVVYRSVGFCAMKLVSNREQQISIFDNESSTKRESLGKVWDKLEDKFGKNIIKVGI